MHGHLRSGWRMILYLPILAIIYFAITIPLSVFGIQLSYSFNKIVQVLTVLIGTWFCCHFLDKRDLSSMGFCFDAHWLSDIGVGILLGASLTGGIFVVEMLLGWIKVTGFAWELQTTSFFFSNLFWIVLIPLIAVAIVEETVSRGYFLQTLEEGLGIRWAVLISSAMFGILHLLNPTAQGWADYVIPFTLTFCGVMFASAYLVRRSLWLPIALHFAWNLFEYNIFALTGASPEHAKFLITELRGPAAWVGLSDSSFGPEVGILGVVAMFVGIGILWFLQRHYATKSIL